MLEPVLFVTPVAAGEAWVKLVSRMQIETVTYLTRRTLAAMDLPQAMARCQNPQDMLAEQVRYWQIAQRQYLQSLEKVASAAVPERTTIMPERAAAAPDRPAVPVSSVVAHPAPARRAHDYMLVSGTGTGTGTTARPAAAAAPGASGHATAVPAPVRPMAADVTVEPLKRSA